MSFIVIADDLSGAADCAIGFSRQGWSVEVRLSETPAPDSQAQVVAIDTDTRRVSPQDAGAITLAAWHGHRPPGARLYKKIDSTLRGNWAAEVAALRREAGLAIVAPAFPEMGRTVRDGQVFVYGKPLAQTPTWNLEHAGRDAALAALLQSEGLRSHHVPRSVLANGAAQAEAALAHAIDEALRAGVDALIIDAEDDTDLQHIAHATLARQDVFWVGSGGLSKALAKQSKAPAHPDAALMRASGGPVLTIVGSLSEVSVAQCAALSSHTGLTERVVAPALLRPGADTVAQQQWLDTLMQTLADGHDAIVRIGQDDIVDPAEGARLCAALATLLRPCVATVGALIMTGGETARAMLNAMDIHSIALEREVEPGVVMGLATVQQRTLRIITKAGAFGPPQALVNAHGAARAPT